jgi:hypothetical protein
MTLEKRRWHPVVAGVVIGLAMVATYYTAGRGLGASGAVTRVAATVQDLAFPEFTRANDYFGRYFVGDAHPLNDYLVFMVVGVMGGAFVAALTGRDLKREVLRGPNTKPATRLAYALFGGILVGFAARLARGCTSGLALVGGSQLSGGGSAFMRAVFAGGFAAAWFVRMQWL